MTDLASDRSIVIVGGGGGVVDVGTDVLHHRNSRCPVASCVALHSMYIQCIVLRIQHNV